MGLQVWLPLNGDLHNQGLSGNLTATNHGATVNNSGKIGKCYQLGTAASDISLPAAAMTSCTTECSISFWIDILTWNTSYATFFQAGPAGTAWTTYVFGFLRNNAASTCCFTISNGSSASNASYLTPALDLNKWYHISLVYKTGHCLIYINGSLYKDYTTSIVPKFTNITTIKIGRSTNGSSYQTNCLINDFRIYDHALSTAEVAEIAKGLVLHYKLDDLFYERTIYDCSGYQNNGTIVGNLTAAADSPRYQMATYMNNRDTTNRIQSSKEIDFNSDNNLTVSFWAKCDKTVSQVLFAMPKLEFALNNTAAYVNPATARAGFSTTNFITNQWNHIIIILSGTIYSCYINGIVATSAGGNNNLVHNGNFLYLFNRNYNKNYAANATISDFRIYTTAFTPEQVADLYHTSMSIDNQGNIYARELIEL